MTNMICLNLSINETMGGNFLSLNSVDNLNVNCTGVDVDMCVQIPQINTVIILSLRTVNSSPTK